VEEVKTGRHALGLRHLRQRRQGVAVEPGCGAGELRERADPGAVGFVELVKHVEAFYADCGSSLPRNVILLQCSINGFFGLCTEIFASFARLVARTKGRAGALFFGERAPKRGRSPFDANTQALELWRFAPPYSTALMAAATALRLPLFSAATQMRPESTP